MHNNHEELVNGFFEELKGIFENSEQGIYLYLDDMHKVCNKKFASLLGYKSPADWAKMDQPFPEIFVDKKSQNALVGAYQKAMEKMAASTIKVKWKKKSGKGVSTTVILVPIAYKNHLFALHFVY